jgi:hypothetical protein
MVTAAMHPAGQGYLLIGVRGSEFTTGMSFVHCAPPNSLTTKDKKEHKENLEEVLTVRRLPTLVLLVSLVVKSRQNKSPSAIALGDWFPRRTYFLTSKASPNDSGIVIIVIIIVVGEAKSVLHIGGIIAQTINLNRVTFSPARYCQARAIMLLQRADSNKKC